MMTVQATNLALALSTAIRAQEQAEAKRPGGGGPSAILQGWRDLLAALRRGEAIEIEGTVNE